jgi:hypothetical protein
MTHASSTTPCVTITEPTAYKTVCNTSALVIQQDWIHYAMTFSSKEIYLSLIELGMISSSTPMNQVPPHLADEYRTRIVPDEMKQDRGNYSKLIDFDVLEEHVFEAGKEVCYLMKYTYELKDGSLFVENEHIWCINEDDNWKIEFHGTPPVKYSQSVFNLFKNICCVTPGN